MMHFDQMFNRLNTFGADQVGAALIFMQNNGSHVRLHFGENGNEVWECMWIAKQCGICKGFGSTPHGALLDTLRNYRRWKEEREAVLQKQAQD